MQLSLLSNLVSAQQTNPVTLAGSLDQQQTVNYPSSFFTKYNPATDLDMVKQLPGFELDDGSEQHGFSAAAGNFLINRGRPSAKEDAPSANAFIETTRWFGMKMRLLAENIPDLSQQWNCSSFTGARNLSVVEFREITTGHEGARLSFLTSGSF